jgi:starch phosphorylase
MEEVKRKYPKNNEKMSILSCIEEGFPKMVRMANLCIISSHTVNGVAEIHSQLIKTQLFKDFHEYYPGKFTNITNGVTPRRWIHCAFRELSDLLTQYYGSNDWLGELSLLEELPDKLERLGETDEFLLHLKQAKLKAKKRLADWVKENCNIEIDHTSFLFDVQVKRIHEYKRQFMNALYCVHRYLTIKSMPYHEKEKLVKRVTFFGGKAAPGYLQAKNTIKLINLIANYVNKDQDTNRYFKMVFLPDYKVSTAQIIIPAADLSQHISTAGTEASGTSNMKFAMTGSLIIGTRDGANIEIAQEIGEDNIFYFGKNVKEVDNIRNQQKLGNKPKIGSRLRNVFDFILSGKIGDCNFMRDYINNLTNNFDFYLYTYDFYEYLEAQEKVDRTYANEKIWETKIFNSICRMGFFSSDRSIQNYAEKIWKIKPIELPNPTKSHSKRVISLSNLRLDN